MITFSKPEDWNLTPRQVEILCLMTDEMLTSKEVGFRLGLSFKTVDVHVDRIIGRMQARSRVHAIVLFDRERRRHADAIERDALERQQQAARAGRVHCGACGGAGFVRSGA